MNNKYGTIFIKMIVNIYKMFFMQLRKIANLSYNLTIQISKQRNIKQKQIKMTGYFFLQKLDCIT